MLTDEDIAKLAGLLATKEDIEELKTDLDGLRESVQALTLAVDKLTKAVTDLKTEYAAVAHKLERHEKWIKEIAEKVGIKLEF